MLKITEYSQRSTILKEKVQKAFFEAGMHLDLGSNSDMIRLVFAGQYSAGKSSILKMLTGRNDIKIGAEITTQEAHTYIWNGIEIIDTPGIHTELRPDHDEISYEAIVSADMLVFVITNELFDAYIADHFRKLAIEKDKAGEMILVVNKMERAAEGNSECQRQVIREDLRKVLMPYTPEQLNLSFLDAESYLDSVVEKDSDPELAEELFSRSGYSEFLKTLNCFVNSKSLSSKLTTDLYIIDDCLEKAIKELQTKSIIEKKCKEVERHRTKLSNFIDMRAEGEIDKESYTKKTAEVKEEIAKLSAEIEELQLKLNKEPVITDYKDKLTVLQYALEQYTNADEKDIPESVIEAFVVKIVVRQDGFDWYLRFDGDPNDPLHMKTEGKRRKNSSVSVVGGKLPTKQNCDTGSNQGRLILNQ